MTAPKSITIFFSVITLLFMFLLGNAQDTTIVKTLNPATYQEEWKKIVLKQTGIGTKGDKGDPGPQGPQGIPGKDAGSISVPSVDLTGRPALYPWQFGAFPNDGVDDTKQVQAMLDSAANHPINRVHFSAGQYDFTKEIMPPVNPITQQTEIWISGAGTAYTGRLGDTKLYFHNKSKWGLAIQNGKGFVIEYLFIQGQNIAPDQIKLRDLPNPNLIWVTPGCSDNSNEPYSGIIIDPVPNGNRGGSTLGMIRGCTLLNWVDCIAVSPSGKNQNADLIRMENITVSNCKNGVSFGNSQTRTDPIDGIYCWNNTGSTETIINGRDRGYFVSTMPNVRNLNTSGGIKFICKLSVWMDEFAISASHGEQFWAFGGYPGAAHGDIAISNSHFDPMPSIDQGNGNFVERARVLISCNVLSLDHVFFSYFQEPNHNIPIVVSCRRVNVTNNTKLQAPIITVNPNAEINYSGNEVPRTGLDRSSPNEYGILQNFIPGYGWTRQNADLSERKYVGRGYRTDIYATGITYSNKVDGSAKIKVADWMVSRIAPGDYLLGTVYESSADWSGTSNYIVGCITSINSDGTGTISGMPYGLPNAGTFAGSTLWIEKISQIGISTGDIEKGSAVIKNITSESKTVSNVLQPGDRIDSKLFYPGVYVVSVSGNTVTMSAPATDNGKGSVFGQGMNFLKEVK